MSGLADETRQWSLDALLAFPQQQTRIDVHCVTRWSKTNVEFRGVALKTILARCSLSPLAKYVSFTARTERRHSTSLELHEALRLGALLATECDGHPLEASHGGPLRLVIPNRYFYKSLKWLEHIEALAEDRPGYWETEARHHNTADPSLEQRYEHKPVTQEEFARRIASRDISGCDFSGVQAEGLDLSGLDARGAILRGALLRGVNLNGANLDGANLTNSCLREATLREATLRPLGSQPADAEGVDFRGADLRGATFVGVSLLGATFCSEPGDPENLPGAVLDPTTRFDSVALDSLSFLPRQERYVRRVIGSAPKV